MGCSKSFKCFKTEKICLILLKTKCKSTRSLMSILLKTPVFLFLNFFCIFLLVVIKIVFHVFVHIDWWYCPSPDTSTLEKSEPHRTSVNLFICLIYFPNRSWYMRVFLGVRLALFFKLKRDASTFIAKKGILIISRILRAAS